MSSVPLVLVQRLIYLTFVFEILVVRAFYKNHGVLCSLFSFVVTMCVCVVHTADSCFHIACMLYVCLLACIYVNSMQLFEKLMNIYRKIHTYLSIEISIKNILLFTMS